MRLSFASRSLAVAASRAFAFSADSPPIRILLTTRVPAATQSARATTVPVTKAALLRRANLRKRYPADGGHACTVSSFK